MLPRSARITAKKDFDQIFRRAKTVSGSLCMIKVVYTNVGKTRFAFIVSTKTAKEAVDRNLIKRRLRAAVRELGTQIKPGFDVVVIAKPQAVKADYAQLKQGFVEVCVKAGICTQ